MTLPSVHPSRILRGLGRRSYDLGVRAHMLPYRRLVTVDTEFWEEEYRERHLGYYESVAYLPPYSILIGYLREIGGEPTIVDIGSGSGVLRKRLGGTPLGRYVGVDHAPAAIDQANAELGDDRTTFVVGESPPDEFAPYDVAICNEVLYCVPDAAWLLDRIRDAVRPGGHVLMSIWRHRGDIALQRMLDERFELVDRVEVQNLLRRKHGWRMSWHRRRD
jgi:2-polyprenyl-6-hydroxyphenyl methylase/3-demethylubiquinone-9 3-methyltransferase